MHLSKAKFSRQKLLSGLMLGTMLGGLSMPALAQTEESGEPAAEANSEAELLTPPAVVAAQPRVVRAIRVEGSQRIEPDTVRSYVELSPGDSYTREDLDEALRDLFETE
ncbi:MAG: outer membrane protein assembly factor BamA, partial [Sphingomonadales bacterium]|nr:outer membrane protein assembly factor BamA [Sphingomonadales bacterium]